MMGRFKHLKLFACLLVFVFSIGLALIARPQAASAAIVPASSSVSPGDVSYVIVYVQLTALNIPLGGLTSSFAGDTIKQEANNTYYIVNSSGSNLYQIPSTLNLDIVDAGDGNHLQTYCNTDASGNYLPCGGNSITPVTPLTITSNGVIQYSAYFSANDEVNTSAFKNSTSQYLNDYVGCVQGPAGVTITDNPPCNTNYLADLTDWTIQSCTDNTGSGFLGLGGGCTTSVSSVTMSLPISSTYKAPAAPAGNPGGTGAPTKPTCESSDPTLGWLLCKVYEGAANTTQWLLQNLVQPLLTTEPIDTNSADGQPIYKIWSNFRIYGNIVLVIALLVIVFGEAVGGGGIDAYTAKKMLPRILAAAILINLSIYIVAIAVDVTNVIGAGVGRLITAPLGAAGTFQFNLTGTQEGGLVVAGLSTYGIAGWLGGIVGAFGLVAGAAVPWLLLFVIMPALFAVAAAFITIVLRKAIIVFLIIISPIAFALWCLPNTEQTFKRWWDLLWRTLAVYPIIMAIFAIADVLSVTLGTSFSTGVNTSQPILAQGAQAFSSMLGALVAFSALFLPLILIPFSFRIAGGAIGRLHESLTNYHQKAQEGIKGSASNPNSMRNRYKNNFGAVFTRRRAQSYRQLKENHPRLSQIWNNSMEAEAELTARAKERADLVRNHGDDSILNARASFVDPVDGLRKTLDGKLVDGGRTNGADWRSAQVRYPQTNELQAIADYRSTKINSTEEAEQFARNFGLMAQQQGLSTEETTGIFTGLAFARQNERGEYKHGEFIEQNGRYVFRPVGGTSSFTRNQTTGRNRAENFLDEQYYKRGQWEGSRMHSSYFKSMADIKSQYLTQLQANPQNRVARDRLKQVLEIEDAFGRGGSYQDETGQRVTYPPGLQGASAGSQAAYNDLRSLGTQGTPQQQQLLADLRTEVGQGQTYEATTVRPSGTPMP